MFDDKKLEELLGKLFPENEEVSILKGKIKIKIEYSCCNYSYGSFN